MFEWFIKYWLEVLFTAVVAGLGFLCKKFYSLYKKERQHQKIKEQKEFYDGLITTIKEFGAESLKGDQQLQEQINIVTSGILNIQGNSFKAECRSVLQEGHEISLSEFEAIQNDYDIYKSLGGNHDGDTLYEMVKKKVTNNITD